MMTGSVQPSLFDRVTMPEPSKAPTKAALANVAGQSSRKPVAFHYHGTIYTGPKAWRGGWRLVIPYHKGTRWLRLLDVAILCTYKVPLAHESLLRPVADVTAARARRAIIRQRRTFKRCGREFARKAVKTVLQTLGSNGS